MKKALRKFMVAFVLRAGQHVQPHRCSSERAVTAGGRWVRGRAGSPLHAVHKGAARTE
jgi:hypothetical protein